MANEENFRNASFEEKYRMFMGADVRPSDVKRSAEQAASMCLCVKCPSYAGTDETGLVFCTIGKSTKIQENKGCLCPSCAISRTMSLRWDAYCIKGDAASLSDLAGK